MPSAELRHWVIWTIWSGHRQAWVLLNWPEQLRFAWQLPFIYCLMQNRSSTDFSTGTSPVFRVYHTCQLTYLTCCITITQMTNSCIHPLICRTTMTSTTCWTALMQSPRLHLLNLSKTEALVTGTRQQVAKFEYSSLAIRTIHFANTVVPCSKSVCILGVAIDSQLTFDKHVTNAVQSCNYDICSLRHIRSLIDKDTATILACAICLFSTPLL